MSLRQVRSPWLVDVVTTTDATPTVVTNAVYVVPSGAAGFCDVDVVLRAAATVACARIRFPFRNVSGTLTRLTALPILALAGDAGLLTAVLDSTQSGTTFQPRITGIALTSIEWLVSCAYVIN
jgi:hypothetical protein